MSILDSYTYGFKDLIYGYVIHEIIIFGLISRKGIKQMNYAIYKGNTKKFTTIIRDENLNFIDLNNCETILTIKKKKSDNIHIIQKIGNNIDAINGKTEFIINPSDTIDLQSNQYVWDIQVNFNNGDIYTVAEGTLVVKEKVN